MLSIDKYMYRFLTDLQMVKNDQNSIIKSDAPANPQNNISNGGLGYFGAYSVSTKQIVIR